MGGDMEEQNPLKKHRRRVESIVRDFILRRCLTPNTFGVEEDGGGSFPPVGLWLVALSGGADSVCLFRMLLRLGFRIEAAHCNFHLRGAESDRDERFVRDLCVAWGVRLHVASFDTRAEVARTGESIEMAARRLRYEWFDRLRAERSADCIAVAHHKEDSAETLLLNLLRGSGLRGLCGICPRNGQVVRPLLPLGRGDIELYLKALGQGYVTDSTNLQPDCRRNEVRLRLLPLMAGINPSVCDTLAATAGRLAEAEAVYRAAIDAARPTAFDGRRIPFSALRGFPSPEALFHELVAPYGFTAAQEEALLRAGHSGVRVYSERWELLRDRDAFLLFPRTVEPVSLQADCTRPGSLSLRPFGLGLRLEWDSFPIPAQGFAIPREATVFCADADAFRGNGKLLLRTPCEGDRFLPFGMRGSKLVSDFLTDRKFDRRRKALQPLLLDGERIAWVVGLRPARPFCLTASTRRVLRFRLLPEEGGQGCGVRRD